MDMDKKILQIQISIRKKWLADHDYIINKVFLGEWQEDDERYLAYKAKRAEVRAELDLLNAELEALEE